MQSLPPRNPAEAGKTPGTTGENLRSAQFVQNLRPPSESIQPTGWLPSDHLSGRAAYFPSVRWPGWRAIAALALGLILRLWMFQAFPQTSGDPLVYGDLGRNLLLHHRFALTDGSGDLYDTLIRLPGYPLFLAACFAIFGVANYQAAAYIQIALELAACLLLADFVRRIASPRAALITLWLACLCPFTAAYASTPLTESLTLDMICLALWSLERYLQLSSLTLSAQTPRARWPYLLLFTFAISYATMLRPDGALLAVVLWPALIFLRGSRTSLTHALRTALICALLSLVPFVVWAARNWQVFHLVQPLAPRYATDPGESTNPGWQHWVKTWCLDFTCTYEFYWNVTDQPIDASNLPTRAFDSPRQAQQTQALIDDYNQNGYELSPELDARFESLASERAAAHPLRTHILLPLGRLLNMTLRPRVEDLPIDLRWWQYQKHGAETQFCYAYAILNLFYLILGIAGLCLCPRLWPYLAAYLVLRSLLLMTVEAPETRYTLEFFPVLFAAGGIALEQLFARRIQRKATAQ